VYAPLYASRVQLSHAPDLLALLKNPYLFTPPNFDGGVSGRHHEMARQDYWQPRKLGSEEALWNGDIRIQAEFVSIILGVAV